LAIRSFATWQKAETFPESLDRCCQPVVQRRHGALCEILRDPAIEGLYASCDARQGVGIPAE